MTDREKPKDKYLFISYSHHELPEVAEQLAKDLEALGYEVFLDKNRLIPTGQFDAMLVEGLHRLEEGGWFLYLMTPSSVRPDRNYCLNEVTWADYHTRNAILPLRLRPCEPPLTTYRIQYYPIDDCIPTEEKHDRYREHLEEVQAILERRKTPPIRDEREKLEGILKPMAFDRKKLTALDHFTGREWVLDKVKGWLENPNAGRIFHISGGPGTGKSAIGAWLVQQLPQNIRAVHFCDRDNVEKSNVNRIIRSIACQLSFVLEDYGSRLKETVFRDTQRYQDDAIQPRILFEELIIDPLTRLNAQRKDLHTQPITLLIDGLDEAGIPGRDNELAKLIGDPELQKAMPTWIRWILTARGEPQVTYWLQSAPLQIDLEEKENQRGDFKAYYEKRLDTLLPKEERDKVLDILVEKAEKSFLYCELMCEEIRSDPAMLRTPDRFPTGMNGYLARFFRARFPEGFDDRTRQILSLMAAAVEPLTVALIREMTGMNQADWARWQREVGALIRCEEKDKRKTVHFYHATVREWLTGELEGSQPDLYEIEPEEGHRMLAEYGWAKLEAGQEWEEPLEYEIEYLGVHLYGSATNPERDTTIRDRLVGLFSKTFAYEGEGKLPQTVLKNLLDFLVTLRNEEDEIAFKRVLSQFMNNQKGRKNYDSIFRLGTYLRDRFDYFMTRGKSDWGTWLIKYQHDSAKQLVLLENNNDNQHALAESWYRMGDIFRISGDQRKAMDAYNESYSIMGDLFKRVTDNDVWRKCLFISLGRMGDLLLEQDDPDRALEAYAQIQRQLEKYDDNRWKHYLSVCKRRMGDILRTTKAGNSYFSFRKMGEISPEIRSGYDKESEELYRASLKIMEELTADSSNLLWKKDLNLSLRRVAEMEECKRNSDMDSALKMYMESKKVIQEMLTVEPDNTEWLHQLGISLHCIARVQRAKGNLDIAARALEESHRILEKLNDCNYRNTELQQDLAVSFLKMGELKEALGETDDSLGAFQEAVKYLEGLVANNPENKSADRWKGLLVYALRKKAEKEQHINRETAVYSYHAALEYLYELYGIDIEDLGNRSNWSNWKTKNVNWYSNMKDYIVILFELGSIEMMSENPSSGNRRINLALHNIKIIKDPELIFLLDKFRENLNKAGFEDDMQAAYENTLAIRQTLTSRDLGLSWSRIRDVRQAQVPYKNALRDLEITQELVERDPGNTGWQRDLGASWNNIGDMAKARGNLTKAQAAYGKALAIMQELVERDPGNTDWQRDLSVSWNNIGDMAKARGNLTEAQAAYGKVLAIMQALVELDPGNTVWQWDYGISLNRVGRLYLQQGDTVRAKEYFLQVLEVRRTLVEQSPKNVDLYIGLAFALLNLCAVSEHGEEKREYLGEAYQITKALVDAGVEHSELNVLRGLFRIE